MASGCRRKAGGENAGFRKRRTASPRLRGALRAFTQTLKRILPATREHWTTLVLSEWIYLNPEHLPSTVSVRRLKVSASISICRRAPSVGNLAPLTAKLSTAHLGRSRRTAGVSGFLPTLRSPMCPITEHFIHSSKCHSPNLFPNGSHRAGSRWMGSVMSPATADESPSLHRHQQAERT